MSFLRPFSLWLLCCILLSMRDECLLLGTPSHCLFHHLIRWWCGFPPCSNLSWSSFLSSIHSFIIIPIITFDHSYLCHHHIFLSHQCTLQVSLIFSSHHSYTFHYWFDLRYFLLITTVLALDTLRSMVHQIFYTYAFLIHKSMGLDHRVFEPSFPSFLLPYHPSLRSVPCLRPPWGHGIICNIWQSLLGRILRFSWYLDVIMLSLLGCVSLMFGSDSIMGMDDW